MKRERVGFIEIEKVGRRNREACGNKRKRVKKISELTQP